ncbi:hypothetical protein [Bradyrhizobium sp. HKCCYLR20261]|uniref:hypothetical protein n=1 Tax=Bradyrhizobium sp. HKCCYLR20261 TaxID=3420760 RepID=UPI003EBD0D8E
MSAGLFHSQERKLGPAASPAAKRRGSAYLPLGAALFGLATLAALTFGMVGWVVLSVDEGELAEADASLMPLTSDASAEPSAGEEDRTEPSRGFVSVTPGAAAYGAQATVGAVAGPASSFMNANASLPPQRSVPAAGDPAVLSGLRISSQSWQRGGMGSKALVTFTLRNSNGFAVRGVEINCAFSRRDGSHVTERRRVVPGEVGSRSRKTFAAVPVGFVNVNVSTAKCALVAATKI